MDQGPASSSLAGPSSSGHTELVDTVGKILVIVLLAIPVVIVGVLFVWGAIRDGRDDQAVQRRLGIKRKTRLGR
jgi:hypothetical protein